MSIKDKKIKVLLAVMCAVVVATFSGLLAGDGSGVLSDKEASLATGGICYPKCITSSYCSTQGLCSQYTKAQCPWYNEFYNLYGLRNWFCGNVVSTPTGPCAAGGYTVCRQYHPCEVVTTGCLARAGIATNQSATTVCNDIYGSHS